MGLQRAGGLRRTMYRRFSLVYAGVMCLGVRAAEDFYIAVRARDVWDKREWRGSCILAARAVHRFVGVDRPRVADAFNLYVGGTRRLSNEIDPR